MMTIAITGSSGFIGKHFIKGLGIRSFKIIELDIDKGFNLLFKKDIKRIPKFDVIIHLAGRSFVPQSFMKPWEYYYQNYALTLNVLELARKYHAKIIFFSSYLYGTPEYLPINEIHPLKPHNPYAQSKLICEKLIEGYNRDFGLPVIIFRPFNIYGLGQNNSFLIPSIIKQLNKSVISLMDPRPKRDFINVSDVINAIELSIEYHPYKLEIFNLGSGISVSVDELARSIIALSKNKPELIFSNEYRQNEVLDTVADISKIKTKLKWTPKIDLSTGLSEIINNKFVDPY